MKTTTKFSGAGDEAAGAVETESLNEMAQRWHNNWIRRKNWHEAEATADLQIAKSVAMAALKNAADLGLSVRTFILYDRDQNKAWTVYRVVGGLLADCFEQNEEGQSDLNLCIKRLVKESGVRVNCDYEQNDPGMPEVRYATRETKYYLLNELGRWTPMAREHLKTLAFQHGINPASEHGVPSEFDDYLLWLVQHRSAPEAPLETDLGEAVDCATAERKALPPVLIGDFLHQRHKLSVGGGSKSRKTWFFLHLAASVATGSAFLGHKCKQGKVLYVNFELDDGFFLARLDQVLKAAGLHLNHGQLIHWCLRGKAAPVERIMPEITARALREGCVLVIIDPVYKLFLSDRGGRKDENSASDITSLMNEFEKLAVEANTAVAFAGHFSKGNQAGKESIDRVSGSGVFARDPDSILTLTRHEEEDVYVVEATLRNLPPVEPFCIRWHYPLFERADECDPAKLKQPKKGAEAQYADADWLAPLFETDGPIPHGKLKKTVIDRTGMSPATFNRGLKRVVAARKMALTDGGYTALIDDVRLTAHKIDGYD